MTLNYKCYLCGNELNEGGALLFSPPITITSHHENNGKLVYRQETDKVVKEHFCITCYGLLHRLIEVIRETKRL